MLNTLKDIHNSVNEGFFSNVGNDKFIVRDMLIQFCNKTLQIKDSITLCNKYQLERSMYSFLDKLNKDKDITYLSTDRYYGNSYDVILICPETMGNVSSIPDWFKIDNKISSHIYLYIQDMTNLTSLKGLPNTLHRLVINNCPRLATIQDFPQNLEHGLWFKPDEETTYLYKDIVKKIRGIKGQVAINKKSLEYDSPKPKKEKLPTMKDVTSASANKKSFPDVAYATEHNASFSKPVVGFIESRKDEAPMWTIDRNTYVIVNDKGDVIGFTTKKLNIIYRKGIKIMTIMTDTSTQMMYGVSAEGQLKGDIVCRIEFSK